MDQVYHIVGFAGGCGSDPESLFCGCALDGDAQLDVSAGETAPGVTAAGSMGWFNRGWRELCMDQEITKALGPVVGYQGLLRDGFLQAVDLRHGFMVHVPSLYSTFLIEEFSFTSHTQCFHGKAHTD